MVPGPMVDWSNSTLGAGFHETSRQYHPSKNLNPHQITLIQTNTNPQFGLFDNDKDQRIDYHEFKVALKALGFDLPKPEILSHLTTHGIPPDTPASSSRPLNANNNNNVPPGRLVLTLPAFQSIAATLIANRDPRDEILRAFALFDTED